MRTYYIHRVIDGELVTEPLQLRDGQYLGNHLPEKIVGITNSDSHDIETLLKESVEILMSHSINPVITFNHPPLNPIGI